MRTKSTRNLLGTWACCVAAVLVLGACSADADQGGDMIDGKVPEIGEKMPGFTLVDVQGNEHSLSDYAGKVVVINFVSQECPYSRAADPHVEELYQEYKEKDVVFLGIDSHESTTPAEIVEYMNENELTIPILKDPRNVYADRVQARVTPEFFVLDTEHKVVYHGALDEARMPGEGEDLYLKNGIEAALAGTAADPATTKAIGCTIKRVS